MRAEGDSTGCVGVVGAMGVAVAAEVESGADGSRAEGVTTAAPSRRVFRLRGASVILAKCGAGSTPAVPAREARETR